MAAQIATSGVDYGPVRRKASAALLLALTIFALISIVTFNRYDLAANQWPPNEPLMNWCGVIGARLASWLLWWFGMTSFALVIVVGIWSAVLLFAGRFNEPWMKLFGSTLIVSTACSAAAMFAPIKDFIPSNGGAVGLYLVHWLRIYCGTTGSWLIIALSGFFGLLFLGLDRVIARQVRSVFTANSGSARLAGVFAGKPNKRKATVTAAPRKVRQGKLNFPDQPHGSEEETELADDELAVDGETETGAEADAAELERRAAVREHLARKVAAIGKDGTKKRKFSKEGAGTAGVSESDDYAFPPLDLLEHSRPIDVPRREEDIRRNIEILERMLADFKIQAEVVDIDRGPAVTRYELMLAPGIKVNRITGLANDIAMAVKAHAVRVVAPIPGKSTVGVEIPNTTKEIVRLRELIESDEYRRKKWTLPLFIGKDSSGAPVISDLAMMPHLLIAGATGSGKSVCINAVITSILMVHHPDEVRLILVDPKVVEMQQFDNIPQLLTPVITDLKRATWILDWATKKMDERYAMLARARVRHIKQYNALGEEGLHERLGEDVDYDSVPMHLPYIVIIVDEMADLMMMAGKEVEISITRLAQKSRAVGIHLILATQRPSVDVITGLIKANLPTRISFQVCARVDSRTILDRNGADALLGSGDMLFIPPQSSDLVRVQGAFVSDKELRAVVRHVTKDIEVEYALDANNWGAETDDDPSRRDDLYNKALRIVLDTQRGSVSQLQRDLAIGYTRAARLVDMMAAQGIVGPYKGSQARKVMFTLEEWLNMQGVETAGPDEAEEPSLEAAVEVGEDEEEG